MDAVRNSPADCGRLESCPDFLLFAGYWRKADGLMVSLQLVRTGNRTVAAASSANIPDSALPQGVPWRPANEELARRALGAIPGDSLLPGGLSVRVWPDRGESATYHKFDRYFLLFQASRDCYAYVLHTDIAGKVTLIFPNRLQENNRVMAGVVNRSIELAVTPPLGTEVVQVLVTDEPIAGIDSVPYGGISVMKTLGATGGEITGRIRRAIESIPAGQSATFLCTLTTAEKAGL